MTDEEREKLCKRLRKQFWVICDEAADEIERLAIQNKTPQTNCPGSRAETPERRCCGMTDEERQKLCDDLWLIAGHERPFSHAICAEAADEIERLAKELANANRLLEINRRRSLDKSGGLEIKQSDVEPSLSDQMYGFHGAGFDSSRGARND